MKIGVLALQFGHKNIIYNLFERQKLDYTLFVNDETKKSFDIIPKKKIKLMGRIREYSKIKFIYDLIKISYRLRKKLIKEDYDLINLNMVESIFAYALTKKKYACVVSLHGTEIYNFLNSGSLPYKSIIKPQIKKVLDKSLRIISVSYHQIANLPEKYKKKTVVIPNGVDSNIFKPLKNIKQKKNVILFTGRFIDIKGIREIINVAKQLPQYEFWFAGQGPLASLINLPNTKNLGFKSTEELVKLYNQATTCIFPSYREGFGLVGLEAMSCGKAVIVTPLGFSEYIKNEKDGIIIPSKDEKALKTAIVDLMENPAKRKRIEKNARKKALKYSWDKIAKQYLKVFKEVVKGNKKLSS